MDVQTIMDLIHQDKQKHNMTYRRYPVRFLFLEMNSRTQDDIVELVNRLDGELLDLSDYLLFEDGWLTKSQFLRVVKDNASKDEDTFILGFSELIRFYSKNEIQSTILSLFDIENENTTDPETSQRRIYIVCFSMADDVYKVLHENYHRFELMDPFLNGETLSNHTCGELCFVTGLYKNQIDSNIIATSSEWLGLWRRADILDYSSPIWCCSENLYQWHAKAMPDNAFQIDVVSNVKDYLNKVYYLDIVFPYDSKDEVYWRQLKKLCAETPSARGIQDILECELKLQNISTVELAEKWFVSEDGFDKWLIEKYIEYYISDTCLGMTLISSNKTTQSFISKLWELGYLERDLTRLNERKALIEELSKYANSFIPEAAIKRALVSSLVNCFKDISLNETESFRAIINAVVCADFDGSIKPKLVTWYKNTIKPTLVGTSAVEKELLIALFAFDVIDSTELAETYPLLYYYLFGKAEPYNSDSHVAETALCTEYLCAYRESRVMDHDNNYLSAYYESHRTEEDLFDFYYSLEHQEQLLANEDRDTLIYILDGVGAEYLLLLSELFNQKGYRVEYCNYGICHLPSITSINKNYLQSLPYKEWILDFDEKVIHGDYYKPDTNLRKALEMLDKIVSRIITEANGKRIALTADHGSTARPRWAMKEKKYNFSNSEHEGRCCRIDEKDSYDNTEDYIVFHDEMDSSISYLISVNGISLYNKPKFEAHGGATLEELLVPVIIAAPKQATVEKSYSVVGNKLDVTGLDKNVRFMISPAPEEEVFVIEANDQKHQLTLQGALYCAELSSGREQDLRVCFAGKNYSFRTVNRSKKNMEGNDGFDD